MMNNNMQNNSEISLKELPEVLACEVEGYIHELCCFESENSEDGKGKWVDPTTTDDFTMYTIIHVMKSKKESFVITEKTLISRKLVKIVVPNKAEFGVVTLKGNMTGKFAHCEKFNCPVDKWDVSKVTNMDNMFDSALRFNQNLSTWNVSQVTSMDSTFRDARDFNGNVSNWDVSRVTNMRCMFMRTNQFDQNLSEWSVASVENMRSMFRCARHFHTHSIEKWDVGKVTTMSFMFCYCDYDKPLKWNVEKVTDMSYMFYGSSFNKDISGWNVINVTRMDHMFQLSVFNQPVDNWNVENVTNMSSMFKENRCFNQPLNSWNIGRVKAMAHIFEDADEFVQLLNTWPKKMKTSLLKNCFRWGGANYFGKKNLFQKKLTSCELITR